VPASCDHRRVRDGSLIPRFGRARRDSEEAVLEGFHAVKHALRFGAQIEVLVTPDAPALAALAEQLAPDVGPRIAAEAREVDPELFAQLVPLPPKTGAVAIARRPAVDLAAVLAGPDAADGRGPVVLLENPRDLGNIGACVRVAAAADAAAVLATGTHDPWHPDALRGAAGLHFALPVAHLGGSGPLQALDLPDPPGRPLIGLDPDGEELDPAALDPTAILAFGTERDGLSDELAARADALLRIPMRAGVSSLNLATAVAAVLFAWRLAAGAGGRPAARGGD
jgi:TrmH family RNA methyltransferase